MLKMYSYDLTYNQNRLLTEYELHLNIGPVKCVFTYEGEKVISLTYLEDILPEPKCYTWDYVWEGENVKSIGNTTFTYNDIIDNLNVPIPFNLIPYSLPFDPLINGIHRSANMISTMSEDESCLSFSYKRNEDGDIERIDVTNLYYGYYYYYLIEYCD